MMDEHKLNFIKRRINLGEDEILLAIKRNAGNNALRIYKTLDKMVEELIYDISYEIIDFMHIPNEIYDELMPILEKTLMEKYGDFAKKQIKMKIFNIDANHTRRLKKN